MNCKSCAHYELFKMVTSGKPNMYCGDIPRLRCSRFKLENNDEYVPASKTMAFTNENQQEGGITS